MTKISAIVALIDQEANGPYSVSENLRNAALYAIQDLDGVTTAEWTAACSERGINAGTARNRLNEVRRLWADEFGEMA